MSGVDSVGTRLEQQTAVARRDLARLNFPLPNWVPERQGPDGGILIDVLVVGGGQLGQTVGFALLAEGVSNIRIVDRAREGRSVVHFRAHGDPAFV